MVNREKSINAGNFMKAKRQVAVPSETEGEVREQKKIFVQY